ncbi:PREDICTED: RIMS-binding protein 3A-like [Elephantulus edwardii]|uniref:RIMS-binding protein 3A-like n=1 Tax=Elephantulus edwardii TaxID=28737 RepID=UPI0003F0A3D6|nr:PREDICTED: RIMS-binding protein 3A-like [Elephantulus edwardii]
MTKDNPSPSGGSRASPKKPRSPCPAEAVLEDQKRELEKVRAELEAERERGRADRRRFAAQARQLREAGERKRQQLADHLRSKWEAQRNRELRQLQEAVLREREAEIRQLLRWKEAELRQQWQLLDRERDDVVRQARALQRQLAEELLSRGHCGRRGGPRAAATRRRCRLPDDLVQLRWEIDGRQAAHIRHLQAALDAERQLFLKYILEHFRWRPAASAPLDPQTLQISEELPPPETTSCPSQPTCRRQRLRIATYPRSQSLDSAGTSRSSSRDGQLPSRACSLESLGHARNRALGATRSHRKTPKSEELASSSPDQGAQGSPSPSHPPPSPQPPCASLSEHRKSSDPQDPEGSGSAPCEALTSSPSDANDIALVKRNLELAEALRVVVRRCSALSKENSRLRRAGFPDEAKEKVKRLKVKNMELTDLARRLEDRARQLRETNLQAMSALGPAESAAELRQDFMRLRSQDLTDQARALLTKDKQIEELQRECRLLQVRFASGLASPPLPERGACSAQWLGISDLDRLLRESQWEVMRLQRQLMMQRDRNSTQARSGVHSEPCEEAQGQVQELECELGSRSRACEEVGAWTVAARQWSEEVQLQAVLCEGTWLVEENVQLQAQSSRLRKVEAERSDCTLRQLGRVCQENNATGLLAEQLFQQVMRGQDKQQQMQPELENAFEELQTDQEETPQEATQVPKAKAEDSTRPAFQPEHEDQTLVQSSGNKQKEALLLESPATLEEFPSAPQAVASAPTDSKPQATKDRSNSSSEVESVWATVLSCANVDLDTTSEVDDLELDGVSPALDVGGLEIPASTKPKIFLAQYSYNPFEGPNEHPEGELPLTAGDYVFIFGDMDEDGFYEGELKDGRQGLVPSNLLEQVLDSNILDCLTATSPNRDLNPFLAGQEALMSEDQEVVDRESHTVALSVSPTDMTLEILDAEREAHWSSWLQSLEEQRLPKALLGVKGALHAAPMQLGLQRVTATSVDITWVCSSPCHPHVVYLDGQEHAQTPAGVNSYTFHSLLPATQYKAQVAVQLPQALTQGPWERMSSTLTFATPLAGPPDPPLDVLVECHSSAGFLVVSWLPVTIDSAGSSNGVQVTGYAVYVDGIKVAEVASATAGTTSLNCSQLQAHGICQRVSVRTMSLCGESPDSVPAQIPEDLLTYHQLPSPTEGIHSHFSVSRTSNPVFAQEPVSTHVCGTCQESQAEFLETLPKEPQRRQSQVPSPISEEKCLSSRALSLWKVQEEVEKNLLTQEGLQYPRTPLSHDLPTGEENHSQDVDLTQSPTLGLNHVSPKPGSRRVPCRHKPSLKKVIYEQQDVEGSDTTPWSPSQQCESSGNKWPTMKGDSWVHVHTDEWQEQKEDLCIQAHTKKWQEQKKALVAQNDCGLACEPNPVLCPALPNQVDPTSIEQRANSETRVFLALFDYEPQVTSANPQAAEEELAFQKGQLVRVWGPQDANGFYRGEHSGQVGIIPGHLVAQLKSGVEWADERWQLPTQVQLCSVACLKDFEEVTGCFPTSQGSPGGPQLWTPKIMMAALDYNARDRQAGGWAKDKLVQKAGDQVTVCKPLDDNSFYYVESGGHQGLIPAHLLDHMSFHTE